VALDALGFRPKTAHPVHRDIPSLALESEQLVLRTREEFCDPGVDVIRRTDLGASRLKHLEIEEFVGFDIFADCARNLLFVVTDHEGVKILECFPEQMAGIETVGVQDFDLHESHDPKEEQCKGHNMNGHHQKQDPTPGARYASNQTL
jgi:hypothetical protein